MKNSNDLSVQHWVLIFGVPNVISVVIYILFTKAYENAAGFVISLIFAVAAACVFTMWRFKKAPLAFYIAFCSLIGITCSSVVGYTSYDVAFSNYLFLRESNSYANILATEPAESYANAGKIVFAAGTRVDSNLALGYKDGTTYCVAPIIDEMMSGVVEFWAVGTDCCNVRGSFQCDDAWTSKARSGVVLRDPTGNFMRAVRQAEASFELAASVKPVFVRWVVDPEKVQWNYHLVGIGIQAVGITVQQLLYALGLVVLRSVSSLQPLVFPRSPFGTKV